MMAYRPIPFGNSTPTWTTRRSAMRWSSRINWQCTDPLERYRVIEMADWQELDTTAWEIISAEVRGKRPKEWVREPAGARWLRKQPRVRAGQLFPYEPAIEWLMLRLAARAGLT